MLCHNNQPLVPSAFKFAGNQSIGWIDCVELPLCSGCFEARLLQSKLHLATFGMALVDALLDGVKRSLDAYGPEHAQHRWLSRMLSPKVK